MSGPKVLGVSIEDAISDFSRIDDTLPGGGLFGRRIVTGHLKLGDKTSVARFYDMVDLDITASKLFSFANAL